MLLRNCTCVTLTPPLVASFDLRIAGDAIVECAETLSPKREEEVHDLKGKIVMPGFVNAHTHLYSSLSRGMPGPKKTPHNFLEILRYVWWKLDRALDDETIYYSALIGAIEAVQNGTTALVDHHASPRAIPQSLDIIKEAMNEVGIRGILCYEVSDRDGRKIRDEGVAENERFIKENLSDAQFRGVVGAHASFTLSDESLKMCEDVASRYKTGVHIHAAEDRCDVDHTVDDYGCTVIERLDRLGVLKARSILAHCIHVLPHDFRILHTAESWLVHNPRSNINNRVGHAPVHQFGRRAALGTDGFPANMFVEAKIGSFKANETKHEVTSSRPGQKDVRFADFVTGGQRMISEHFDRPFGAFAAGSVADLVVLDYQPPTEMESANVEWHYLFGMQASHVESVMVGGKWVVTNRMVNGIDVPAVYAKAQNAATKLWEKMETVR